MKQVRQRERVQRTQRQHRLQALARFREWDEAMTRQHGKLYHRKMRYTLH